MSALVKRLARNTQGRDLLVGDVHGCFGMLEDALDEIDFNGLVDRVISVGDLVDRGPHSAQCLEWLAKPWFHAVLGNHELMAAQYAAGQFPADLLERNGGGWFLRLTDEQCAKYATKFVELPVALEIETVNGLLGVVHAECPTASWQEMVQGLLAEDPMDMINRCVWGRNRYSLAVAQKAAYPVEGIFAVVNGHTVVQRILRLANSILIDTGACFPGRRLTIVDARTLEPATAPVRQE